LFVTGRGFGGVTTCVVGSRELLLQFCFCHGAEPYPDGGPRARPRRVPLPADGAQELL